MCVSEETFSNNDCVFVSFSAQQMLYKHYQILKQASSYLSLLLEIWANPSSDFQAVLIMFLLKEYFQFIIIIIIINPWELSCPYCSYVHSVPVK